MEEEKEENVKGTEEALQSFYDHFDKLLFVAQKELEERGYNKLVKKILAFDRYNGRPGKGIALFEKLVSALAKEGLLDSGLVKEQRKLYKGLNVYKRKGSVKNE